MRKRNENLIEYIQSVKQLEIHRHTLESLYDELEEYIDALGIAEEFEKPEYQWVESTESSSGFMSAGIILVVGLMIGGLVNSLIGWLIPSVMTFFVVASLVIALFCCISGVVSKSQEKEREEQNLAWYERQVEEYNQNVRDDAIRVKQELKMAEYYAEQAEYIAETYNDTVEVLELLYEKGGIYEKYQYDIAAICMFSEYLESERCYELKGHEGAYNLFEYEKRMDLILYKLDEIIERLDEIKENQEMIYQALTEIQAQQERILNGLNTIAEQQSAMNRNQKEQRRCLENIEYNTACLKYNDEIRMIFGI